VYEQDVPEDFPPKELEWVARAMVASPRGKLLVDLFLEARNDPSVDASLARLWSLLEVMAERMKPPQRGGQKKKGKRRVLGPAPFGKRERVQAAMAHLGLSGGADWEAAYRQRNLFVHRGERGDPAIVGALREQLFYTCLAALARARFQPVDPNEPSFKERYPGPLPKRKIILSKESGPPDGDVQTTDASPPESESKA
jgi:hypothetical protein